MSDSTNDPSGADTKLGLPPVKSVNPYSAPDAEVIARNSVDVFSQVLWRSILTIAGSMFLFGILGGLLGMAIGFLAPYYYRTVFRRAAEDPSFDPIQVGGGLGVTQGVGVGLFVGVVAVLAAVIFKKRVAKLMGKFEQQF